MRAGLWKSATLGRSLGRKRVPRRAPFFFGTPSAAASLPRNPADADAPGVHGAALIRNTVMIRMLLLCLAALLAAGCHHGGWC